MKSVLLIGLGTFGSLIAKELSELGHEVMAIDRHEEHVNEILPLVTNAQIGDSSSRAFLSSLGVKHYDVCIVTIGDDFQSSLITTSLLKELGAKYVVSRSEQDVQSKFLLSNGADMIINPKKQMANWTAVRCTSDHLLDYIQLEDGYGIYEIEMPQNWIGKNITEVNIRQKYGINILGIRKNGKLNMGVNPKAPFEKDTALYLLGEHNKIRECFNI